MSEATTARLGRADLQIHTAHGDGMGDAAAIFDQIEAMGTLNVMAVTDHDDIEGALLAREVHARGSYSFEFVPGIEVTTRQGHLLGLWVDEPLRSFRSLEETVAAIHEQALTVRGDSPPFKQKGYRQVEAEPMPGAKE